MYTWIPVYKAISQKLLAYEQRQIELIKILKEAGIKIPDDQDKTGSIPLEVMDPFTFFNFINKHNDVRRLELLNKIAELIGVTGKATDTLGIPSIMPLNTWLFKYKKDRSQDDIPRLWQFFKGALSGNIDESEFNSLLHSHGFGVPKLTAALFSANPDVFFPINRQSIPSIAKLGLNPDFSTYAEYKQLIDDIRNKINKPLAQISYEAYLSNSGNAEEDQPEYSTLEFDPKKIKKEHVLRAIDRIDAGEEVLPSTLYDVVYNDRRYPPKEVMRLAQQEAGGPPVWRIPGGDPTNSFLRALGFSVGTKNQALNNELNYWKWSPGPKATHWNEFRSDGKLAISYKANGIGDLSKFETLGQIEDRLGRKNSNEAFALWVVLKANPGDIVFANRGRNTVVGIGVIQGSYQYLPSVEFEHQRPVKWLADKEWTYQPGQFASEDRNRPTLFRADTLSRTEVGPNIISEYLKEYPEYFEVFEQNGILQGRLSGNVNFVKNTEGRSLDTTNIILYGPPGTGKTYETLRLALDKIGVNTSGMSRTVLHEIYDKHVQNGQIVFTTFHQSLSYEDFIEGIKPVAPERSGDPVNYRVEHGIFRNICTEAAFSVAQLRKSAAAGLALDFSDMYDRFVLETEEKLDEGQTVELETRGGGTVLVDSISEQGNIIIKHHDGVRAYTVSKSRLSRLHTGIENHDEISNIGVRFREIIGGSNASAYWAVLNAIRKAKKSFDSESPNRQYTLVAKREIVDSLSVDDYKSATGKPFVLIIDEINRGNVSQVFGELITLLENDKRLGNPEGLFVTLPYSKEKFGVPSNLFIIGTMNTADRSIEALDTALRRRFSFVEMMPRYDLPELKKEIAGVTLVDILKTINKRIEKLQGKDHQIGHSYLLAVENTQDLKATFSNKINPLLQEYFYGDPIKLGLVLGKGFLEESNGNVESIFADFDSEAAYTYSEAPVYRVRNAAAMSDEEFMNAIRILLNR